MKKDQSSKVTGLSDYKITLNKLLKLNRKVELTVYIKFPNYEPWFKYHPDVREKKIEDYLNIRFLKLKKLLADRKYEEIKVGKQIRGINIIVDSKDILLFLNKNYIERVYIKKIKGLRKRINKAKPYFAVKAQNKILFEGIKSKYQKIEEFVFLVKAKNHDDAAKKVIKEYKLYEKPYLNPDNIMVLWKIDRILDVQEVIAMDEYDLKREGAEVYSVFKHRKLKKEFVWKPIKKYLYK